MPLRSRFEEETEAATNNQGLEEQPIEEEPEAATSTLEGQQPIEKEKQTKKQRLEQQPIESTANSRAQQPIEEDCPEDPLVPNQAKPSRRGQHHRQYPNSTHYRRVQEGKVGELREGDYGAEDENRSEWLQPGAEVHTLVERLHNNLARSADFSRTYQVLRIEDGTRLYIIEDTTTKAVLHFCYADIACLAQETTKLKDFPTFAVGSFNNCIRAAREQLKNQRIGIVFKPVDAVAIKKTGNIRVPNIGDLVKVILPRSPARDLRAREELTCPVLVVGFHKLQDKKPHKKPNPESRAVKREDVEHNGADQAAADGDPVDEGAQQTGPQVDEGAQQTGPQVDEGAQQTGPQVDEGAQQTGPQVDEGAQQTGPQVDGKKKKPKKKKDPVPVLPVSERQAYCQFFVLAIDAFGGQYAFTISDCYPYEGRWTAQKLIDKFHAHKQDDNTGATARKQDDDSLRLCSTSQHRSEQRRELFPSRVWVKETEWEGTWTKYCYRCYFLLLSSRS